MKILILILSLIPFITTYAGPYGQQWISMPSSNDSSQIWFRRDFIPEKPIMSAHLSIVSQSDYKAYINGWQLNDDVYDVADLFDSDTVTVALWYSNTQHSNNSRFAAVIYGTYEDGENFAFYSNASWTCHAANSYCDSTQHEFIDGTLHSNRWKHPSYYAPDWQYVSISGFDSIWQTDHSSWRHGGTIISKIIKPISQEMLGDTLIYDFGRTFQGKIRITLRGMQTGDIIKCNNFTYICRGVDDEQAFTMFIQPSCRDAIITSNNKNLAEKITKIEALVYTKRSIY